MKQPPRILKGNDLLRTPALPADLDRPLPTARVPAALVAGIFGGDTAQGQEAPVGRVIRKSTQTEQARPYVLTSFVRHNPAPEGASLFPSTATAPAASEPEPPLDLDAVIAAQRTQWQAEQEALLAEAREQAFQDGFAAAQAALQADYEERLTAYQDHLQRLTHAWDDFLKRSEPMLASLAFEIAQSILDAPLPAPLRAVASRTIIEAVEQLGASTPITISMHPVDFLRLQESGLVDQLDSMSTSIRWEPSPDLKQGDWIVQSQSAAIRRMEQELMGMLKSRVGLYAAVQGKARPHSSPVQPEQEAE